MGQFNSTAPLEDLLTAEWLATNGLGSYASSTVPGANTRKYHGLLVAATSPPVRQMVLLARVDEFIYSNGQSFALATCEYPGVIQPQGHHYLRAFNPHPFPRWAYQGDGWTIEKQLRLLPGENTVCISYTLLAGDKPVEIDLRPLFALRGIHELMYQWNGRLAVETTGTSHHRIPATNRTPEVFFAHDGQFTAGAHWYLNTIYRRERERGYAGLEDVWMPGVVRWKISPGQTVNFICSTDPIDLPRVVNDSQRHNFEIAPASNGKSGNRDTAMAALVRAAGQFVVHDRDQTTFLTAGYPWTTPLGRDAMIGFTGLLLVTGRLHEAASVLEFFAARLQNGLMPSELPWDASGPKYSGADVSLWFINAVWEFLRYGGDAELVKRTLRPVIEAILRQYQHGTSLGITIDSDGLLSSREAGTPTTWMDAKTGEWVVTPRAGRAVEVNALWYNALRIAGELAHLSHDETAAAAWLAQAAVTHTGFNARFWNESKNCCFDVLDNQIPDAAIRPNQILAISLPFPVLSIERCVRVLDVVSEQLLTPVGLRTLEPSHANYVGRYAGNVVARDSAYHQGSVFPWWLGPFVSAYVRVRGRSTAVRERAGKILSGVLDHMSGEGMGQICELFDGDQPHRAGGLHASARSVGEILRCYAEDVLDLVPPGEHQGSPMSQALVGATLPTRSIPQ